MADSSAVTSSTAQAATQIEPRAYEAYEILHWSYFSLPLIAGVDKFSNLLTHWDSYLAPLVTSVIPLSARTLMMVVGVVEIVAALVVAVRPRIGAYVVAVWLAAIIANLIILG